MLPIYSQTLHLRCLRKFWIRWVQSAPGNVLCYRNKRLIGYFEFMHGSRIICLPLNIPDKIALTVCLRKTRRGRDALLSSSLIPTHPEEQHSPFKRGPPPFFHPDTNPVIGDVLVHSVDKTYVLVVTVELIWLLFLNIISFNFVPTPTKSPSLTRFRRRYINRPAVVLTTVKVTLIFCLM